MHVLSVIHGTDARTELFAPVVEEAGHGLDEWSFGWGTPPPRPLDAYDAVLVFGGAMHADQDAHHPWLRGETLWLQQLLVRHTPVLGVCLGVQLLARASGAWVGRMQDGPEIGWCGVELTEAAAGDSVLGVLPPSFEALQWHHYTYGVPAGAVELARSVACTQAFRLGDACFGDRQHCGGHAWEHVCEQRRAVDHTADGRDRPIGQLSTPRRRGSAKSPHAPAPRWPGPARQSPTSP